jgi:hypothetical protein
MQLYRLIVPVLLSAPLSLGLACAHAQTTEKSTTTTTTTVITTAVPAPKEAVVEPEGYVSCTTVPAGWKGNVWYNDYKVCRYDTQTPSVQGEAWVGAHWQCSEYTSDVGQAECTNWEWADGRWVTTYAEVQ